MQFKITNCKLIFFRGENVLLNLVILSEFFADVCYEKNLQFANALKSEANQFEIENFFFY